MPLLFARGRAAFSVAAVFDAANLRLHFPAVSLALAGLVLSGCGTGARLYSPERDKQGQAAKTEWDKVDLKTLVEVPRQNLAKTLAEQVALEDEIWAIRRERQAAHMASTMTVADFREEAGEELVRVIGGTTAEDAATAAAAHRTAMTQANGTEVKLDGHLARFLSSGVNPPPCSLAGDPTQLADYNTAKLVGVNSDKADIYIGVIPEYVKACAELKQKKAAAADAAGGSLRVALDNLNTEEGALEADKAKVESLLISLKTAQAEYAAAEKELLGDPTSSREKVDKTLANLKKIIAKLPPSANPDATSGAEKNTTDGVEKLAESAIASKVFSQERIDSINNFLATYDKVAKGEGAAAGSNRAAIALALFPDLQDKSQKALADAAKPNLTPLVLRKTLEQVKYDTATRDVARREMLIDLRRQLVANLDQQSEAYLGAYQASRDVPDGKLADALAPYDENKATDAERNRKIAAWRASTRFLEAEGQLRAIEGKTNYQIYALQNEGVLLYVESSIQQWNALIGPSVDLLAQYGAAGITSKDVIDLFNSLMLLGIAVGVN